MVHLGIDVAKDEIVVWDGESVRTVPNRLESLSEWLSSHPEPGTLTVESTGGYEGALALLAFEAGWRVHVLQPAWVKAHARVLGGRSKSDAVDARVIRSYLRANEEALRPWRPREEGVEALRALLRQRQSLGEGIAKLRASLEGLGMAKARLDEALQGLLRVRERLDSEMRALLAQDPKARLLLAVPGVGVQTAAAVLVAFRGGEFPCAESFVAFAGLDPVARDSGKSSGQRRISKRGDRSLRRALFMAAFGATRLPCWKPRYEALRQRGMPPTKAQVALARKIAVVLYAVYHQDLEFDPERVQVKERKRAAGP
jgi:transposase